MYFPTALLRRHWALLPGLLVGAFLRLNGLFPTFLYGDAAEYATVASGLAGDPRDLRYPGLEGFGPRPFVSQPPLVLYLFALGDLLTGSPERGPVLVSALLGLATLGLVYAIGLRLQGPATGGTAAFLLGITPSHVHFSRTAQLDAAFVFFFTLAILLFLVWLDRRTRPWAVAAGAGVAATLFAKYPGFLVLGPVLVGTSALLALDWWRGRAAGPSRRFPTMSKETLRQVGLAALPTVNLGLLYGGLLLYLRATGDLLEKLGWQLGRVAGTGSSSNTSHRHWDWYFTDAVNGLPNQVGVGIIFLAVAGGAWLILLRLRGRGSFPAVVTLLAWPITVLAFFVLSHRKEAFYLLPLAPALAVLAAAPVGWLLGALPRAASVREAVTPVRAGVMVGALLLLGVSTFDPAAASLDDATEPPGFGAGVKEAALLIHRTDPESAQIGTLLGRFSLHFYNGQPTYHWYVNHTFVEEEIQAGRLRFVVADTYLNLPHEDRWMHDLVDRHQGRLIEEYRSAAGKIKVQVFDLAPPGA